jgi:hypothetical protein
VSLINNSPPGVPAAWKTRTIYWPSRALRRERAGWHARLTSMRRGERRVTCHDWTPYPRCHPLRGLPRRLRRPLACDTAPA